MAKKLSLAPEPGPKDGRGTPKHRGLTTRSIAASCATCDRQTGTGCSHCKDISYCSVNCQIADWTCHGILCAQFLICQEEHRPLATAVRAILFDPTEDYPTFQWLEIKEDNTFDLSEWFETDPVAEAMLPVNIARRQNDLATQRFSIFSAPLNAPNYRELPRTRCIEKLGVAPGVAFIWRGPIVVAASHGGDINMRDFRAIADFFGSNPRNPALMSPRRFNGKVMEGLKMNCTDAIREFGVPSSQFVMMSEAMVIRQLAMPPYNERLDIFESMGLRLWLRWVPAVCNRRGDNRQALLAHVSIALSRGGISIVDLRRAAEESLPIGSVIMWRDDGKRLLSSHIMALNEWMYTYAKMIVDDQGKITKGNLDYVCTRSNFEWFWPRYVVKRGWQQKGIPSLFGP